jgi:hypothetical protein
MVKNDSTNAKSMKLQLVETVNIESQHVQDILAIGIDAQVPARVLDRGMSAFGNTFHNTVL